MKAFRLIGMALVAMCLCMNFASCSNEDMVAPEDPQEEKYVTVGLGCTGEFLEFSNSPLSRTTAEELYGIQVYALAENGTNSDGSICYLETPYAHGVFVSLDNVKIKLLENQLYKFEVSIAIDPYKFNTSSATYSYTWFNKIKGYQTTTDFIYSGNDKIDVTCIFENNKNITQYKHDRYYGELEYTSRGNGIVEIQTKRVAYGVKYETIGLGEGESIVVEVSLDRYKKHLYNVKLDSDVHEDIYTFNYIQDVWNDRYWNNNTNKYEYGNYKSEKKLTLNWNKADGTAVPMGTYNVTFKRNVMTTIKIKAENLNLDNGIKVFKEEVAMIDDENIYEIEGGTVTEVPVIPGN